MKIPSPHHIVAVTPPLTEIHCAVIQRLFSETRRSAASAISSTVPRRSAARESAAILFPIGFGVPSGLIRYGSDVSVGIGPGASVLTVIP